MMIIQGLQRKNLRIVICPEMVFVYHLSGILYSAIIDNVYISGAIDAIMVVLNSSNEETIFNVRNGQETLLNYLETN